MKLLSSIRVYFKLLRATKTPFIRLYDSKYYPINDKQLFDLVRNFIITVKEGYLKDKFDCDDYAWVFKAMASRMKINIVGFVDGRSPLGSHAWNVALCQDKVYYIEPQTGSLFKPGERGYRAWAVLI